MSKPKRKTIGVIGAINVDEIAFIDGAIIPYDSNRATCIQSLGGVGANIARNLNKLGHDTTLITAYNPKDKDGLWLSEQLNKEKLSIINIPSIKTAKFIAFCDQHKDLHLAINDMKDFEKAMNVEQLKAYQTFIQSFDILILDANFSNDLLSYLVTIFNGPIYAEAISKTKVSRLKPILPYLKGIKLNEQEALSLLNKASATPQKIIDNLITLGPKEILLTLGSKGALIADENGLKTHPSFMVKTAYSIGAGDAFFAGYLHGHLSNQDKALSAFTLAKLSLETQVSVHPKLTRDLFDQYYKELTYERKNHH